MSIRTRLEVLAPKYSNFTAEVKKRYQASHILKGMARNLGKLVEKIKLSALYVKGKANDALYQVPTVKLTMRRGVQREVESMMFSNSFKAKCQQGVKITDGALLELIEKCSAFMSSESIKGVKGAEGKGVLLFKVRSKAGDKLEKSYQAAVKEFVKSEATYERALRAKKSPRTLEALTTKMKADEEKMEVAAKERGQLKTLVNQVRRKALGEKAKTRGAAADAVRVTHALDSLTKSGMDSLRTDIVENSTGTVDAEQKIKTQGEASDARFFEKMHEVFTNTIKPKKGYQDEVTSMQRRQLIWGTDKLHSATSKLGGYTDRMPGLEYYLGHAEMHKSKYFPGVAEVSKDQKMNAAFYQMHSDWSAFIPSIQATMAEIRNDGTKFFDMDRLEEYQRLEAMVETVSEIERILDPANVKVTASDVIGSYGEDLGFGNHPGADFEALAKAASENYPHLGGTTLRAQPAIFGAIMKDTGNISPKPFRPNLNAFRTNATNLSVDDDDQMLPH